MSASSWAFPVLIVVALVVAAGYFLGRRKNVLLMKLYADAIEGAVNSSDQQYTWVGGYIGFKADYKVKSQLVKKVKATLHLLPRLSLLYYPFALLTMRHDKLYVIVEVAKSLAGEAHLIKKGHYRFLPPGIDDVERLRRSEVTLGDTKFELLSEDAKGERQLLSWAQGLKVDFNKVKHLSFTASTNVMYAFVEPDTDVIPALLKAMPELAPTILK